MRRLAIVAAFSLISSAAPADMYQDASNAKLPEALVSFGHGTPLAASALCTTASGSSAVTGCPSTAGIAAGMVVKGPGIPAGATVAGGVTASGFTLSANATASAAPALLTIRHLPFSTEDGGAPSIWRFPGRVMIGNAIGLGDSRYTDPVSLTFCPRGSDCPGYIPRDSDLAVMSSRGGVAVSGMSRASDGAVIPEANSLATIGVSGVVVGDMFRTFPGSAGWASYWEVQLEPAADGSTMMGMEIALKNKGGNYTSSAYTGAPGVVGIRLSPGADPSVGGANLNPINTGILFGPISGAPSYKFNKGIIFNNLSLVGSDGTTGCCGTALEMAKGHMIAWKSPDNGDGLLLHSEVTVGANGLQVAASNNLLSVLGAGGSARVFEMVHVPSAVNTLRASNAVAGQPAVLNAASTVDVNVGLALVPQGTGTVNPAVGLKLPNYTVATLPACNAGYKFVMAAVSDAAAPSYNATIAAGGAIAVPVMCDGAAWKAH